MWIRTDNTKRNAGLTAVALGAILFIWGGYSLVRKVGFWGDAFKARIDSQDYITTEIKEDLAANELEAIEEINYISNNIGKLFGGLTIGFIGAYLVGSKENYNPFVSKETDYKSHSDWRRESSLKGTPDNPFRL